jgi:CubicO group peptidase (beta-lactamase class C family)
LAGARGWARDPRDGQASDSPGLAPAPLAELDRRLKALVDSRELAGVAVLAARHGRPVHRLTYGYRDLAAGAPLSGDTIYRIYSMTKPVTAVAMMKLFERGLWSPDDPIAEHLPEFEKVRGPGGEPVSHPPTMRELMTHTAGFGYGVGSGPFDETDAAYVAAGVWQADGLRDLVARVAKAPLAYQPGSAWRYSISVDLQGAIIERLSGESLPAFMRDVIFDPLCMADTDFFVPPEKMGRLSKVYRKAAGGGLVVVEKPVFLGDPGLLPRLPSGGGGLYSTVTDYGRFAQMLLNGGELGGRRVLEPASVALMMSNHLPATLLATRHASGLQSIGMGRGYGFDGAVIYDPDLAGMPVGRGTYQWDGASGVWFWVDPANDLLFIGMIQRMDRQGFPRLQEMTQSLIANALLGT